MSRLRSVVSQCKMSRVVDDKSEHCVPFIVERLLAHRQQTRAVTSKPFFIGLQGVQGAGKTTLVETLQSVLSSPPHNLKTLVLSIDDLYLPHSKQLELARSHPSNALIQHRGQPSTHDVELGSRLFEALEQQKMNIRLPSYDKAAYSGAGDRRPESEWQILNTKGTSPIEVIIFEGWCVGFRSLPETELRTYWEEARSAYQNDATYSGQLGKHELESLTLVNDALKQYDTFTDRFSCFIQIDAEDLLYVYDWRAQQELALHQSRGSGMTPAQVVEFVNGYYPAYELYTTSLRKGIFPESGKQLRLVVDKARKVVDVKRI